MENKFLKIQYRNLLQAFIINVSVVVLYFCFFNMVYESNDEWAFSSFLSGAYGLTSSHLVFSNIFYGGILEFFYGLEWGINWFTIFELLFSFVSLFVLTYICLMRTEKYNNNFSRCIIAFVILVVIGFEHYYFIQWTKTAYLVALAGAVLMFYEFDLAKPNKFFLFSGILLVLIGSCLRFDSVYVILAFSFVRCVYNLMIEQRFQLNKEYFKANLLYITSFSTMIILVFGFRIADRMIYEYGNQKEEWKYYLEYNVLRSDLLDYGIPDYKEFEEEYNEIGLYDTDIAMIRNWCFADSEVFNVETFQQIVNLKETRELSINTFVDTYYNILEGGKNRLGLLVLFVIALVLMCGKKKHKLLFCMYFGMSFLLYGYLTYMNRVVSRVEYGIWLCMLFFLLYDFPKCRTLIENKAHKFAWISMTVCLLFISLNDYNQNIDRYMAPLNTEYRELFNYTNAHKENIYMRDVTSLSNWTSGFSPLEALPYGYLSNIFLMGGWEIEHIVTDITLRYPINNPWRECVNSNNIFIIDNGSIEKKVNYIKKRYCSTAEAILYDEVAGFKIYQIISVDE